MDTSFLTTEQIASQLQLNPQVVRRKIREDGIEHFRIGNRIRVDLHEFLKGMRRTK